MPTLPPNRPRLRRSFAVVSVEDQAMFVLGERRQFVFEGKVFTALHPYLNGQHTFPEIVGKLGSTFSVMELTRSLSRLTQSGCLTDTTDQRELEDTLLWDDVRIDPHHAASVLQSKTVAFRSIGLDSSGIEDQLRGEGFRLDDRGDFLFVVANDYLCDELAEINQQAIENETPWILVKPNGMVPWIGPIFHPNQSACWECLAQRMRANRHIDQYLKQHSHQQRLPQGSKAALPAGIRMAVGLAALELKRAMAGDKLALKNRLMTLDVLSLEQQEHAVVHRPQCPACGSCEILESQEATPITLQSSPKRLGEQRTAAAGETLARIEKHVSPITGIVTSLVTRNTAVAGPWYNCVAGHYFPTFTDDLLSLCLNLVARSGGKGATEVEAKTGAICESIERYSGICWGNEKSIVATREELADQAIPVETLLQFSDTQYDSRPERPPTELNERHDPPPRFDDSRPIAWTPVWSLTDEQTRYVPTAFCYYGFRDKDLFLCRCDSNGCASGNTLEEAIVQGFLELAERDAVAIWWYNRLQRPGVDVASFKLPYWNEVEGRYRDNLNRDLHCLDLTNDLGVPTFAVVSRRLDADPADIVLGFGSHFDPRVAVLRALKEANQYLPAFCKSPDGKTNYQSDPETVAWWQTATYENQPHLLPNNQCALRTFADFAFQPESDVKNEVHAAVETCRSAGLDFLVLDQSRPDLDFPVAKVIVPGLRHFWRRLAPGRLYDVPVQLGWLDTPRSESELNPISCFV
ncbi:MAG: TOMM precursor leader peptide-binding protein [Rubripirellula sp.]